MNRFLQLLCLLMGLGWFAASPSWAADDLASAQARRQVEQPLNNAPVWKEVRSGQANYTSVRGVDTGVLINSGGQTWRALRNGPVMLYGGFMFCAFVVALGVFYKLRGPIMLDSPRTGRLIQRFNSIERAAHWSMAISFCILMVTGLFTLFGKHVLLPVFGYTLFAWLAQGAKYLHNFVGPVFLLSVLVFIVLFIKDNIWQAIDALWIRKAGGLMSGEHVPSHRFNFGEKTWFWFGVVLLGLVVSGSGLILNFPNFEQGRLLMQQANIVHTVGSLIMMSLSLAHIYIGTVGMESAIDGMKTGYVDEAWAREHHELWYEAAKQNAANAEESASDTNPPAGATVRT
ncbi:MAG: formate dehydrogenase subunit gamma [Sterolibacteriaceae bacterium]|nr:formate dehydrogenase subunit gamma [Sterolibacteriaceae bacterium]